MDISALKVYLVVSVIILFISGLIIKKLWGNDNVARRLALAGVCAIISIVSYFIRVLTDSLDVFAWMTTLHLIGIDFALFFFAIFTICYTDAQKSHVVNIFMKASTVVLAIDIVALIINPFWNISVEFLLRNPEPIYSKITYGVQHPLYFMHIFLAYAYIMFIIVSLSRCMWSVPKEFRRQYSYTVVALMLVMVFNGISVFAFDNQNYLNYSVTAYSLMYIFMYLFAYKFANYVIVNHYKDSVFENVGQAIVLFDYKGRFVLRNTKAVQLLSNVPFGKKGLSIKEFEKACNLLVDSEKDLDSVSLQCYTNSLSGFTPMRCDARKLRNLNGALLGYLFVFTNMELETDLLTGFHNWTYFKNFVQENKNSFAYPTTVIVMDINNLSVVNTISGFARGDQMLKGLSDVVRDNFPKDSYFVRGEDAKLIALCYNMNEECVKEKMEFTRTAFGANFMYTFEFVTEDEPNVLAAIEMADKMLRQRKLLDSDSKHSDILKSLKKALLECDSDSEAHIERTQKLCKKLAKRLDLTEKQQNDLSLLCVIHDIGKIAIPVSILNKPDKLTKDEWKIVQEHVEKGVQIAKSSKEFAHLAEFIRFHHERWDGSGYPDGLSRESIPLLSRIINVVDAYDAMMSPRPYRKAMDFDTIVKELRACAGTQFDPAVVAEFLQIMNSAANTALKDNGNSLNPIVSPKAGCNVHIPSLESIETMKRQVHNKEQRNSHVHKVHYSRYILDSKLNVVSVDDHFEDLTGYSREDIREHGLTQGDLIPEEDLMDYLCKTSEALAQTQMAYFEHRLRCKNGSFIYVFCIGRFFFDPASRESRSEIIINDSTNSYAMKMMTRDEKEKMANQLRHWEDTYRRDSLTGLMNRSAFQSDVEEKLLDGNVKVMLLMMDVDKFKNYNDTYGHQAGDEFLIKVAHTIQSYLRDTDLACRMGGDEFAAALFFPLENSDEKFMYRRAQQIFDRISMKLSNDIRTTGLSMGAVVACHGETSFKEIYEASDKALYKSKEMGRGRLSIG